VDWRLEWWPQVTFRSRCDEGRLVAKALRICAMHGSVIDTMLCGSGELAPKPPHFHAERTLAASVVMVV
jgi:hypothetical protein